MSPRARRNRHASDASKTDAEKILEMMYMQGKAQFGDAMKSFWVYDGTFCPACLARPIDKIKFQGKDALSINGFMYRARGVMIGYFLCDTCANYIFNESQKIPTSRHLYMAKLNKIYETPTMNIYPPWMHNPSL